MPLPVTEHKRLRWSSISTVGLQGRCNVFLKWGSPVLVSSSKARYTRSDISSENSRAIFSLDLSPTARNPARKAARFLAGLSRLYTCIYHIFLAGFIAKIETFQSLSLAARRVIAASDKTLYTSDISRL